MHFVWGGDICAGADVDWEEPDNYSPTIDASVSKVRIAVEKGDVTGIRNNG